MRVLVTGGAGFIGSHLVDALVRRGDQVVVVDDLSTGHRTQVHSDAAFHQVDLREADALERVIAAARPEAVSHHAAQADVRRSMADPAFDAQVNILGAIHLLQCCVKYKVQKLIFASTSAVYPDPQSTPVDEQHPVRPQSAYGLSKYVVEQYLAFYREAHRLRSTIFRYGNVFGPRQDPHGEAGVVGIFSEQLLRGEPPTLFGDGTKTRDYLYVDDVVAANLLALDGAGDGEVYNLGWGREISDFQVFDAVRQALGVRLEPCYAAKRPGELDRIALNPAKAKAQLQWSPHVSFETGIQRAADYYRRFLSRP